MHTHKHRFPEVCLLRWFGLPFVCDLPRVLSEGRRVIEGPGGHPLCGLMARYVLSMARVIRGQPLVLAETMGCVEALGFRRTIQTLAD